MSINEISPSNYSAVGSFMGHPKTAASDYNKGIYRSKAKIILDKVETERRTFLGAN